MSVKGSSSEAEEEEEPEEASTPSNGFKRRLPAARVVVTGITHLAANGAARTHIAGNVLILKYTSSIDGFSFRGLIAVDTASFPR